MERCKTCNGLGVSWQQEPKGQGTGDIYHDPFNKKNPANGTRIRRGWSQVCSDCGGEGLPGGAKRSVKPVCYEILKALRINHRLDPTDFGLNTPEFIRWKCGDGIAGGSSGNPAESVWLASNGMLLIVHGDGGRCEIVARSDTRVTPPVEAQYYCWLNPGLFISPHVELLAEALREYNALAKEAERPLVS